MLGGLLIALSAAPAQASGVVCLGPGGKAPSTPGATKTYVVELLFKTGCQNFRGDQNAVLIIEGSISNEPVCTTLTSEMTGSTTPEPEWSYYAYNDYQNCRPYKNFPDTVNGALLTCPGCPRMDPAYNAASYGHSAALPDDQGRPGFAPEGSAAVFGENLATTQETNTDTSCRNILGGRQLRVVPHNGGQTRLACLTHVSPGQINFYLNDPTFPVSKEKEGTLQLLDAAGRVLTQRKTPIRRISPGIFTTNGFGTGLPSGYLLRVHDGVQTTEAVSDPIRLQGDQVFLILYGTGVRNHDRTKGYSLVIRNASVQHYAGIGYFGAAAGFPGVDQLNVELPHHILGPVTYYLSFFDPDSAPDHGVWSQKLSITIEP